ncbi:MAG TPA: hypothetical protein VN253_25875 [Kofleriaceae bacterium]|nr:hypothetical protein [Kofleriaceae bacterium]
MRKIGQFAFGVTSLLILPAALHGLTAGPKQVAKLIAAGADSLELSGARIDVSVDHPLVDPGDKVKIKLVASAAKAHKVTVDVLVLESMGTYNGRVPEPPVAVDHETLTLEAKDGGGPARELAVRLPGNPKRSQMEFGTYQILVSSPRAITKLERLRVRARTESTVPGWDPMAGDSPYHDKFNTAFYELKDEGRHNESASDADGEAGELGKAALLVVNTRPKDSSIAIRAPEQVTAGETFTVAVTVTNPTKRPVKELSVELAQPSGLSGDYLGLEAEQIAIVPATAAVELAPRETKQVEFRVTAKHAGVLGLYAQTQCGEACGYDSRLSRSALDAVDVVAAPARAPESTTTTAKR